MSALSIKNLWKEYGDQIVLENVSIEIESRAFVALVGPSGCGKSTTLRMIHTHCASVHHRLASRPFNAAFTVASWLPS